MSELSENIPVLHQLFYSKLKVSSGRRRFHFSGCQSAARVSDRHRAALPLRNPPLLCRHKISMAVATRRHLLPLRAGKSKCCSSEVQILDACRNYLRPGKGFQGEQVVRVTFFWLATKILKN